MAIPQLYNDESILLRTQNIVVKSVLFEAVLTNKRVILIDSKKNQIPPHDILFATIRNVEAGENAIRDPILTLSIVTRSGGTRQMILTFSSRQKGEDRKRECDEWVRVLRQYISSSVLIPMSEDLPSYERVPEPEPVPEPAPVTAPAEPASHSIDDIAARKKKKKIEIARPIKQIVDTPPPVPQPVETTSLPEGSTFCFRCGNRVPLGSAFCNKCGSRVVTQEDAAPPVASESPVEPLQPAEPEKVLGQIQMTPPSAIIVPPADKKDRPIEDVIHSIEPLIADSVPRHIEHTAPRETPAAAEPAAPATAPSTVPELAGFPVIAPAGAGGAAPAAAPAVSETPAAPAAPGGEGVSGATVPPLPPVGPFEAPSSGKKKYIAAAVIAIIVIAIIGGVFLFLKPNISFGGGGGSAVVTTTPVPTETTPAVKTTITVKQPRTTAPTPAVTAVATTAAQSAIPEHGVFVYVNYPGTYDGQVGTPNNVRDVTGTGNRWFQISTSNGIVQVSIQKTDGLSDPLTVAVYKDGVMMTSQSTTAQNKPVEYEYDLKPAETTTVPTTIATAVLTTAAAGNATANTT